MHFEILSPRDETRSLDPAVVAAIAAALTLFDESTVTEPNAVVSPWRAAGRSTEVFDEFDAARRARVARRAGPR